MAGAQRPADGLIREVREEGEPRASLLDVWGSLCAGKDAKEAGYVPCRAWKEGQGCDCVCMSSQGVGLGGEVSRGAPGDPGCAVGARGQEAVFSDGAQNKAVEGGGVWIKRLWRRRFRPKHC